MTGTYDGPVLRHYEPRLDIKVRRQASPAWIFSPPPRVTR